MTGHPDQKPEKAIRDKNALKRARRLADICAACGRPPGSVHHVVPRGERGDDDVRNLLGLCGRGNTGCHGAEHGNPYETRVFVRADVSVIERRDAEWVNRRIGEHIEARRPDTIEYVLAKLGAVAGREYLARRYYLVLA